MPTTYRCERCSGAVSRTTEKCPHCSAILKGIRCTRCRYLGTEKEFKGNYCPKCGSDELAGIGIGSRRFIRCSGCQKVMDAEELSCPGCHRINLPKFLPAMLALILFLGGGSAASFLLLEPQRGIPLGIVSGLLSATVLSVCAVLLSRQASFAAGSRPERPEHPVDRHQQISLSHTDETRLNEILGQIQKHGVASLSTADRAFLEKQRQSG
jgi:RNA polymerase subunit RPABC4/transcription elongation factor Spt4